MFGAHLPELLIVLLLALVVFGPKRLPEIGGAIGRGIHDFRKGVSDIQEQSSVHELEDTTAQESTRVSSTESEPVAAAKSEPAAKETTASTHKSDA